jgi:hypothetical protein
MASSTDLWGERAMCQTNGASYEFFAPLLPPLRYVNADFRYYPIVLSAPNALVKARLISNGSGLNLRGGVRSWNDVGPEVRFRVGPDEFLFGGLPDRVSEPTLAEGWLPIVQISYRHSTPLQQGGDVPMNAEVPKVVPEVYRLEAFAATEPELASNGVVFVKFDLAQGTNGTVTVEADGPACIVATGLNKDSAWPPDGLAAVLDPNWKEAEGTRTPKRYTHRLKPGTSATLAVVTKPGRLVMRWSPQTYAEHRAACVQTWRTLLARGMNVETPEPYVNAAWRHSLCQDFALVKGNSIHYSAGNQYDKLYESEGSDAALALMVWGYDADMRRLLVPLLDFTRKGLEYHQAGFKLLDFCRYYWQTKDTAAIGELRPRWEKEAHLLTTNRTGEHGLFPKEQYCGDISTFVYNLNASSKAWRALRDLGAVLADAGNPAEAKRYTDDAAQFRGVILDALRQNVRRETTPPFVPVALFSEEPPHDPILHSRIGNYWNIIIGYTLGSGIFPPGSEEESWIPHYQEQHGGLCMGMLRASGGYAFWNGPYRINPLYGTRYALDTLRRDDPERALVSFYGMLAHGLTRNTFVGAEGCSLSPVDEYGRWMYCPPNSAANAHLLSMLRNLLVQDWDLNDDGQPDTLRLCFATPKRWLEDGKTLKVERAPTAFGPVSLRLESKLSQGEVIAEVDLPQRNPPKQTLLRIRLPDGWHVTAAHAGTQDLKADPRGTVDLSALKGKATLHVAVARN